MRVPLQRKMIEFYLVQWHQAIAAVVAVEGSRVVEVMPRHHEVQAWEKKLRNLLQYYSTLGRHERSFNSEQRRSRSTEPSSTRRTVLSNCKLQNLDFGEEIDDMKLLQGDQDW